MGRLKYTFTLPDYNSYTEEQIRKALKNSMESIMDELEIKVGILQRSKKFASKFIKFHFILEVVRHRYPFLLEHVDFSEEVDDLLINLQIKYDEESKQN